MTEDEELAGRYFDAEQAPGLLADGMPEDGVADIRAQYVKYAVLAPKVVQHLRLYGQMFDAEGPGRRWACTKQFTLTRGELDHAQQCALVRHGIHVIGSNKQGAQCCSFYGVVQANSAVEAALLTNNLVVELLDPYDAQMVVYESTAKLLKQAPS